MQSVIILFDCFEFLEKINFSFIFVGHMEKYIVSARKYRPATFDEVVGQQHVANTLKNALATNHVAHAYLFTGPRGVGKTTCARILAKVLNCQSPVDKHTACNVCESCKSFNSNATFNILELDAASNNSVDHIRALTEQVRFLPQSGKYKIFIIDEVHMLSQAAFNAFLKTLEEPPAHAIFILATTEKHKLLPTILSRCQIFDFKRITQQDIALNLESICKKENIAYDKDALFIIAEKADGAMRDALSILDKVISSVDNQTITYKDVVKNLNLLDHDYFFRIVDAILTEDLSSVLLLFDEITRNGFEGSVFINGLAGHLRQLMLSKDPATLQLLEASENLKIRYHEQAKLARLDFILSALSIANQCDINYQKAYNKQLHIEIALSKMTFSGRLLDLSKMADPKKKVVTEASNLHRSPKITHPNSVTEIQKPFSKPEVESAAASQKSDEPASSGKGSKDTESEIFTGKNPGPVTTIPVILPKIKSIQTLKEEVVTELKIQSETVMVISLEEVNEILRKYIENHSSPFISSRLKYVKPVLETGKLSLFVPTEGHEETVRQELELIEQIRSKSTEENFEIFIKADINLFPNYEEIQPAKILTNKEKFDLFQEKNPLLNKLVDTLSLKLDAE